MMMFVPARRFWVIIRCIAWLPLLALPSGCASIAGLDARKPQPVAAKATTTTPVATLANGNAEITQVGFRQPIAGDRSIENGCGCQFGPCGDASCGNANAGSTACQPLMMAAVPQAWYYDPQEFLCDGGDHDPHASLTRDDRIIGLQPEDTVTHFTTESGDIEFTASNRVCLYSPRFGNVRRITGAILNDHAIAASGVARPVGPNTVDYDQPGLVMTDTVEVDKAEFTRRIDSMRDRNRGVRIENVQQIEMAGDVLAVLANIRNLSLFEVDESQLAAIERFALAASAWTIEESVEVEIQDLAPPVLVRDQKLDALVVYEFPDAGRLNLIKLADKQHAAIGDEVTFALRLQNVGDSPVSNVVVTDNLTTRLEYVADSQTASIDADFEVRLNDASSSQLVWNIQKEIGVGESITIEFKCRVR
ncbi:DUF11 domain-containing protein [Neorhodopirellula pilleata]|uniref:DUF11 domain-containing protein n=1 Tax=Neorhodopirellula pilleata TaxID=2714738 RepID=A0A5C6ADS9_9BACT|nr:DUF11 domain-containing protein [Neorhodopirellula pilleata]TWT97458.1 hypothetical protein Pla100_26120 [Neorhodopirellula pilleata]